MSSILRTMFSLIFLLGGTIALNAQALNCISELNVSLDGDCQSTIMAEDVLSNGNTTGPYTLKLTTATGVEVPSNYVDINYLWTTLMAEVTDANNNKCWGSINIEDKLGPAISCADITVDCYDMNSYTPTAIDACGGASVSVLSSSTTNAPCNDDSIQEIVQYYQAVDDFGNRSSCSQTITLSRFDASTIDWPSNFESIKSTNLICDVPLNADGFPDMSATGVPTANEGVAIYPYTDLFCNISVEYRDLEVVDFGCSRKIMRTWYVYEWVCGNLVETNHVQTLEIEDTQAPVFTNCPASLVYDADASSGCDLTLELQLPTATDDCSSVLGVDVSYSGPFIENAKTNPVVTLSGVDTIQYRAYDDCGNFASCQTVVTIRDSESPTAICDKNSVVSLRLDGTAVATVATFDDGSFDNCQMYKSLIKRESTSCDCDRPTFQDFDFLGEFGGHYYYLADRANVALIASDYAVSFGGYLAALNSEAESDWLAEKTLAITDSVYIGLEDLTSSGTFTWPNHVPVSYANWAAGQFDEDGVAVVSGTNVILNEAGEWVITDGSMPLRYVVELPSACGFSNRVNFCCADGTTPQEVTLRVIDIAGRYNDCTATVTIQDKVAPTISCPQDVTISCGTIFDVNDESFGIAAASDQCSSDVSFVVEANISTTCNTGTISKIWTANDNNGSSSCTQTFSVVSPSGFNASEIIWPADYELVGVCNDVDVDPADLPVASAFPSYSVGACDNVTRNYKDAVYSFAGPESDACAKIVRTWSVLDNCAPLEDGVNPIKYQQAIKINNFTAPTISGCEDITVNSIECNPAEVTFSITALDDCAPQNQVTGTLLLDELSDGSIQGTYNSTGNVISFSETLGLGYHSAVVSYSDRCGNVESCTKRVHVQNVTVPTPVCSPSVSVNIQAMDLDNDPLTPDVLMAPITSDILVSSEYNPCALTLTSSFSNDVTDNSRIFTCANVGATVPVTVYVTDSFGFSGSCQASVVVQDNNGLCNPIITSQNVVTLGGCATLPLTDVDCNSGASSVSFDVTASSSDCSGSYDFAVSVDLGSDGSVEEQLTQTDVARFSYTDDLQEGTHTFSITVTDNCGATTSCSKQVQVVCKDEVEESDVSISGCEDQVFLDQDCSSPLRFSTTVDNNTCNLSGSYLIIARTDFGADGSIDLRQDVVSDGTYDYTFPTPAGNHVLELTITDACGVVTVCEKNFTVTCASPTLGARISGSIYTEDEVAVQDVEVELEGAYTDVQMTNEDGSFEFPTMDIGNNYRVSPYKDNDFLNGISTLDLVHIQRHILGIQPLDSPYKLIAADVDNSGRINGIDLVELRKLILGIYDFLPRSTSWRMIDATQKFQDYTNPFITDIAENYVINNLNTDMNVDFIGVKVGDVNNSAELKGRPSLAGRSNIVYDLMCTNQTLEQGKETELVFSASKEGLVNGVQVALSFDVSKVEVLELVPLAHDMNTANFNLNELSEGRLRMSWHSAKATTTEQNLFKVTVRALSKVDVNEVVTLNNDLFANEAYIGDTAAQLDLTFDSADEALTEGVILYQNAPNPWSAMTEVKYYSPEKLDVVFTIYDLSGRVVYQEQRHANKGINRIILVKDELPMSGVLYYELLADKVRYIEKMVHID